MEIEVSVSQRFDNFSLDVDFKSSARCIGIFGSSGSGKSLTLKLIAGINTPDKGLIKINGLTYFDSDKKINVKTQKRKVGYLFQNYALFPNMTVEQNILCAAKWNHTEKQRLLKKLITQFELAGLEKHLPNQLSGGQQQRVAFARMLSVSPNVILLDEPFSALDSFLKEKLQQDLFKKIQDFEGIVILVSHDKKEIKRFCEEVLLIENGKVKGFGKTEKIFGGREIKEMEFTHFDDKGNAVMVDVSEKDITKRSATATGKIKVGKEVMDAIDGKKIKKGDVLTVSQVAGIMGSKRTSDLIPMCHVLNLTNSQIEFELDRQKSEIHAFCTVKCSGKTGVEMEALMGVSVALLTVYDMCKAINKRMEISEIHLCSKQGGKSGDFLY
ncbi:MAG: cyclic pyranopterin monophosphate synthase MoaC [Treponema sp.]|nr:cyclic pyranopterin monophosphate synthase MoaC [Treponema sp.]